MSGKHRSRRILFSQPYVVVLDGGDVVPGLFYSGWWRLSWPNGKPKHEPILGNSDPARSVL